MTAGYELRINGGSLVDEVIDVGLDVGLIQEYLATGLEPATEYSFAVRAYDDFGIESDWSAEETATTSSPMALVDSEGSSIVDSEGNALIVYA